MKFLVQSDDYGMTMSQSYGCINAIINGIVRNTGIFINMPWANEAFEVIKPLLDKIAFGIDLNLSTGPSVLDKEIIPSLVHENGYFLTSSENRDLDNESNHYDHLDYEEVYKEFDAQIKKYIKIVGKKPDYLHNHAYVTETINRVTQNLSNKYTIPYASEIWKKFDMIPKSGWYLFPPTLENQLNSNLESFILSDGLGVLDKEYSTLVCHVGYLDKKVFEMSSFNIYRAIDLEGVTSSNVIEWIDKNNIELITYNDLSINNE